MPALSRCRRVLLAMALMGCAGQGLRLARIHARNAQVPDGLAARVVDLGQTIEANAVEPPPRGALASGALDGLAWGPEDPFTRVFDDRAFAAHASGLAGQYGGLGVVITYELRSPLVELVHANSPAAAAGLLPGDRICKIDGHSTGGIDRQDLRERLRGTPGSVVALEVWRESERRRFLATATRALVHIASAVRVGWLDRPRGIATVALAQFQEGTALECARALAELETQAPLRALALDLRGNSGGLVGEARQVAELFADTLALATVTRRGVVAREAIGTTPGQRARWPGLPLAVLLDRESASASEILAGALQDHRRALVLGERSFGKAAIQDTVPLAGGHALKLTIARYLGPSGRRLQRAPGVRGGIAPDIVVPTGRLDREQLAERWHDLAIAHSGVFAPGWVPRERPDPVLDAARAALAGERVVVPIAGK